MASNYNRKSASSASRRQKRSRRSQEAPRSSSRQQRKTARQQEKASRRESKASRKQEKASRKQEKASRKESRRSGSKSQRTSTTRNSSSVPQQTSQRSSSSRPYEVIPGGQLGYRQEYQNQRQTATNSVRLGDIDRAARATRQQRVYRRMLIRFGIIAAIIILIIAGVFVLYNSKAFTIDNIEVKGVEHLTATDMAELASVPEGTTLLTVDTGAIKSSLLEDAWVDDVDIRRSFPSALTIVVTERTIEAVVDVPVADSSENQEWAIASDRMWLMPIPDKDSDAGKNTSPKVYEDAKKVLHITDVPFGVEPQVGSYCSDANVNNALAIVSSMTTELADRVKTVQATETESTTLILDNGVEVVFGSSDDIRDKERVCLEIMDERPDVVYINVRVVNSPTWRAVS